MGEKNQAQNFRLSEEAAPAPEGIASVAPPPAAGDSPEWSRQQRLDLVTTVISRYQQQTSGDTCGSTRMKSEQRTTQPGPVKGASPPQGPEEIEELVSKTWHLIETTMPPEESSDCLRAKSTVPYLVQVESDPVKFLKCFDWDVQQAAERLAVYWKRRCSIFGDRAFLPMTYSGKGALTDRERDFILTGSLVILPADSRGRTVCCENNTRRIDHDPIVRFRTVFYMAQVVAENPLSQTDGFQGLTVMAGVTPKYDRHSLEAAAVLFTTMPIKVTGWHIIDLLPKSGQLKVFDKTFGGKFQSKIPLTNHRYEERHEYFSSLQLFGLSREGLPRIVGGSWSYRGILQWTKQRIGLEVLRYASDALSGKIPFKEELKRDSGTYTSSAKNSVRDSDGSDNDSNFDWLERYRDIAKEAMEQIPVDEKMHFTEAKTKAPPSLWENESNIDLFLLVDELNCWLAAKRMARYWELRYEIFGPTKYLSPLNQSSDDALSRADMHVVNAMILVPLPNDLKGNPVLWIDGSRIPVRKLAPNAIERCLFYFFSILAEQEESQKDGAVLLLNFTSTNCKMDTNFLARLVDAMPLHIKSVHIVRLSNEQVPDEFIKKFSFADTVYTYSSTCVSALRKQLRNHFDLKELPKCLGGRWGIEKFCQWQELRTRCEWGLPQTTNTRASVDEDISSEFPAMRPYSLLSAEEKEKRQRRLNVIHTRRKRDRVRVEQEALQEQVQELQIKKEESMAEYQRLQDLLRLALSLVASNT